MVQSPPARSVFRFPPTDWFFHVVPVGATKLPGFNQSLFFPLSALPAKVHANGTDAFITSHTDVCAHGQKASRRIPNRYVPPTEHKIIKQAPITTGNTASPLVFNACPYTRLVTRPISSTMSIARSLPTSDTICGSLENSCIIQPEQSVNTVPRITATITPITAAFSFHGHTHHTLSHRYAIPS